MPLDTITQRVQSDSTQFAWLRINPFSPDDRQKCSRLPNVFHFVQFLGLEVLIYYAVNTTNMIRQPVRQLTGRTPIVP